MFSGWIADAKYKYEKEKARKKIWNSPFALEIYEEVMRDNPTNIAIDGYKICWGNNYPTRTIRFFDRGYHNLHDGPYGFEVTALNDYFIMKSGNKYRLVTDEDSRCWPYCYLTSKEPEPMRTLQKW